MNFLPLLLTLGVLFILGLGCVAAVVMIIKAVAGGGSKADQQTAAEETEMIQEMYHGFRKMEKRIESLETLLLDDESARRAKFDDNLRKG
jgi:phage shock protein B